MNLLVLQINGPARGVSAVMMTICGFTGRRRWVSDGLVRP
jgi:hypothetical protein